MRIALVCSHGGHLTDLLFLLNAFDGHDIFFVTYDNPRTRALPFRKYFLENLGENPKALLRYPTKVFGILRNERPGLVISDGAEIAVPFLYSAKLLGAKVAFIETYTRVQERTVTGRLVYPISDLFLVFWPSMLGVYGSRAQYWGSLFSVRSTVQEQPSKKEDLVFVTVGMHYVGFERLIKKMDEIAGKIPQRVVMQIGSTQYRPINAEHFDYCDYGEIKRIMRKARLVVSQGAMSAIDALVVGTPVITVPRLASEGEVINDHQLHFARRLNEMGFTTLVENVDMLESRISHILSSRDLHPKTLVPNDEVVRHLREFIGRLEVHHDS